MTQPIIRFEGVSKAFGTQTVLRDFSLDVEPGAFVSIIGRSGCGKTTVLKLVNGLLSPDTGRVLIQGQDVARIDPVALRRRIGYAIQSVGLFPHMTVEKNIAAGFQYRPGQKMTAEEIKRQTADYMELLHVTELKSLQEKLTQSAQKVFAKMYEQAQAAQGAAGAGPDMGNMGGVGSTGSTGAANDDVVDADFKEV